MLSIALQLKSNYLGIRYRISMMFEMTATGAVLPSYDVETRIIDSANEADMVRPPHLTLTLTLTLTLL